MTLPASMRSAMRRPLSRSFVKTYALRPRCDWLAKRMAASSLSTFWMGTMGPKISSVITVMSCEQLARTVGSKNWPGPAFFLPPLTSSANGRS